jgi:7-cyano-7-deazaguanine reductase
MTVDYSHLPLGKGTSYTDQYDASLLVAVQRAITRDFWPTESKSLPFCGEDNWTAYEVSWLNSKGKPQIATLTLKYNALSENIVESKSLKLYLNSFNQTRIDSPEQLLNTLSSDIANIISCKALIELHPAYGDKSLSVQDWQDTCIDDIDIAIGQYEIDAKLLHCNHSITVKKILVSHLLRSNCPVTGQPDWASIRIDYQGAEISEESLLRYICSYRLHQGFHEQCIERIFCDIWRQCQPERLSVEGRFTRRGGLDINPFRASHPDMHPLNKRQLRQ